MSLPDLRNEASFSKRVESGLFMPRNKNTCPLQESKKETKRKKGTVLLWTETSTNRAIYNKTYCFHELYYTVEIVSRFD